MAQQGSTRAEIVAVAMRLFVDQGYDQTSLREIAEQIGVTKAALYYHFPTKEDIVRAALDAHINRMDDLLAGLEQLPPGAERDAAFVDRVQDLFSGDSAQAMRFGQVNATAMAREGFGEAHLGQIRRLMQLITEGYDSAEIDLRALLAFAVLMLGTLGGGPESPITLHGSPRDQRDASRRVALDLLAGIRTPRG